MKATYTRAFDVKAAALVFLAAVTVGCGGNQPEAEQEVSAPADSPKEIVASQPMGAVKEQREVREEASDEESVDAVQEPSESQTAHVYVERLRDERQWGNFSSEATPLIQNLHDLYELQGDPSEGPMDTAIGIMKKLIEIGDPRAVVVFVKYQCTPQGFSGRPLEQFVVQHGQYAVPHLLDYVKPDNFHAQNATELLVDIVRANPEHWRNIAAHVIILEVERLLASDDWDDYFRGDVEADLERLRELSNF